MAAKKPSSKAEKKEIGKIVLKSLSKPELIEKIKSLKTEIAKSTLEIKIGRIKNIRKVFNLRKELARVLSVFNSVK